MLFPRKIAVLFSMLFISLFATQNSYGWGKEGHHMVGEVAWHYMERNARDMVTKYLNGMAVDDAATWMDDMRSNPEYKYMSKWHYINIDKGKDYVPNPNEPNIINEINKAYSNLKNRSKLSDEEIKLNILVLFHLVGDLHQPLHAGYGSDRGGNDLDVNFRVNNKTRWNLHSVWDGGIIDKEHITFNDCINQYKSYTSMQIYEIRKIDAVAWMKQSRDLLPRVYAFQNNTIDDNYAEMNKAVIEKQILCGGLRLAAIMDDVFKK